MMCVRFQALGETGTYANVVMQRANGGDTGLHIAIALGRLRAAQVETFERARATITTTTTITAQPLTQ